MKTIGLIFITLFFILPEGIGQAPNNDCIQASNIAIPAEDDKLTIHGNFGMSTPSYLQLGDCAEDYDRDLWYQFEATSNNIQFDIPTNLLTSIALYGGNCGKLNYLGYKDNLIVVYLITNSIYTIPLQVISLRHEEMEMWV